MIWPHDIGPVSAEDALGVDCPKCGQLSGHRCLYTTDTFTYTTWPEYGKVPRHHQGQVMPAAVHQERREAVRARRMRHRAVPATPASPGVRGAAAAMRAWDLEEFEKLRAWLTEFGWLLTEADLEHRPDGTLRGTSYAMGNVHG